MTVIEQFPLGTPIHGEHRSVDASAGVALGLTAPQSSTPGAAVTIGADERMVLTLAMEVMGEADPTTQLFFDNPTLTAAETQVSVDNNGGNPDTFTMAGDFEDEFRVGRLFTVANSDNNNGQYTVTAVAVAAGVTTVSVATGSWTDEDEGDVTANPTSTAGQRIIGGETVVGMGKPPQAATWPIGALRKGPYGYAVYGKTTAAVAATDFIVDGFVQTTITKTGPIPPQARA